jgi:hypothetical protein
LWDLVARHGEEWLGACQPPFWGRPGMKRPALVEHFRRTEARCTPTKGTRPKSVFQIGGAGAVGTGSMRGMPFLAELRRSGFSVWPFDDATTPLVVEIYPRVLTGPIRKSSAVERTAHLRAYPIPAGLRTLAEQSEDAFDAAVSALVMAEHVQALHALKRTTDPFEVVEGSIWMPTSRSDHM